MNRFALIAAALSCVALTACSGPEPVTPASENTTTEATAPVEEATTEAAMQEASETEAASEEAAEAFPATVMSCNQEITFEKAPERIVLQSTDALPFLAGLDQLDHVIALGTDIPEGIYGPEVTEKLKDIPKLAATKTEGGGARVATETFLEVNPDLVIGHDEGADREALNAAGVPLYSPFAWCKDVERKPVSWENVNDEYITYGKIFGENELAEEQIEKLATKIADVEKAERPDRGTGVALYVGEDNTQIWGYGNASMVQPIFDAVGLTNVYADNPGRLIDGVSSETLLEQNPDNIVLLIGAEVDPEANKKSFTEIPGMSELKAVKEGHVYTLPFNLTDPPTPNSVEGVIKLNELLDSTN